MEDGFGSGTCNERLGVAMAIADDREGQLVLEGATGLQPWRGSTRTDASATPATATDSCFAVSHLL